MSPMYLITNESGTHKVGIYDDEIVYEEDDGYRYVQPIRNTTTSVYHTITDEEMENFSVEWWGRRLKEV